MQNPSFQSKNMKTKIKIMFECIPLFNFTINKNSTTDYCSHCIYWTKRTLCSIIIIYDFLDIILKNIITCKHFLDY